MKRSSRPCAECDCPLYVLRGDEERQLCVRCMPAPKRAGGRPVDPTAAPSRIYSVLAQQPMTMRELRRALPDVHTQAIRAALRKFTARGLLLHEGTVYRARPEAA
jgi:hypothetical protein